MLAADTATIAYRRRVNQSRAQVIRRESGANVCWRVRERRGVFVVGVKAILMDIRPREAETQLAFDQRYIYTQLRFDVV